MSGDDCCVIHEDFIGMHPLERTNADQVGAILKNVLLRINLNIQRARGQCYDGAATKVGKKTGVAQLSKLIPSTKIAYIRIVMDMPQIWLSLMP